MTAGLVALIREGFLLALLLVAPLLVAALVAGLVTGLIRVFTQIEDPAVGVVPKVALVAAALVVFAPSIGNQLEAFAARMWPLITSAGTG
ncbi:MAG: flagellar biosynthetic protein FliQ [Kofleriaceae bacterium]